MGYYSAVRGSDIVLNSTATQGGAPFDLTGCRVLFVMKQLPAGDDASAIALLDNQLLGGIVITDAINGKSTIDVPGANTLPLPQAYTETRYEVWVHDTAGREWCTETGTIVVGPRILDQQP